MVIIRRQIGKVLCWFGLHDWDLTYGESICNHVKQNYECLRCGKKKTLEFYTGWW